MRQENTFVGQPIRSLQTMLRTIAKCECQSCPIIPDGIFGKETANALSDFQNTHGLSPTGVADQDTWEMVAKAYDAAVTELEDAQAIEINMDPGQVIPKGEYHPAVLLTQALLSLYADVYKCVMAPEVTGVLDSRTVEAIEGFQMLASLPVTGLLDKTTWKHLICHFPVASYLKTGCFHNNSQQ